MTLRVGYVAREYCSAVVLDERRTLRQRAISQAAGALGAIASSGAKRVAQSLARSSRQKAEALAGPRVTVAGSVDEALGASPTLEQLGGAALFVGEDPGEDALRKAGDPEFRSDPERAEGTVRQAEFYTDELTEYLEEVGIDAGVMEAIHRLYDAGLEEGRAEHDASCVAELHTGGSAAARS